MRAGVMRVKDEHSDAASRESRMNIAVTEGSSNGGHRVVVKAGSTLEEGYPTVTAGCSAPVFITPEINRWVPLLWVLIGIIYFAVQSS